MMMTAETKTLGFMAQDQYGQIYEIGDNPPRKWLLDYCGRKHADKMYVDTADGAGKHIGYIIGGLWLRIFRVCDWQ
jgi:hypothetical protein